MNYDLQSSYAMQFNFGVERSLPGDVTLAASYAGSRGLHLFRIGDANLAPLKGWQLNHIATVQTGHPFEVRLGFNRSGNLNTVAYSMHERPDANPSFSGPAVLGGPARYWDINAFSLQPANQRGNLGRNTLIGPGTVGFDMSMAKSFTLAGERRLEFRGELFNLPNHPNFAVPSGRTAFSSVDAAGKGVIAPDWGVISSTVTTSRQVQLGLKLMF